MPEIYTLSDPETGEVRYIGKANDSANRLRSHLRDARRRNTPVCCWIRKLQDKGSCPSIAVIKTCGVDEWKQAEIEAIVSYRSEGARLLNVALGGDEPFCPVEVRSANGKANANKVHSDPKRKRMWSLMQKLGKALHDGHVGEETKKLMRSRPDVFGKWAHLL